MHTTPDVMDRLKQETAELHAAAERHPFQAAMIRGALGREGYAAYLGQILLVHRALEDRLGSLRADARVAAIATDARFRTAAIVEDLAALDGRDTDHAATQGTARLIQSIEVAEIPELLGMLYVLEGSTNGGRFIARAVGRSLGLPPGPGLRYLDPYGDEQPARWEAFKDDLRAAAFTPAEHGRMVDGAKAMFRGLVRVFDDLQKVSARPLAS